jgi:endonuclease YncB( thermonuclease family)
MGGALVEHRMRAGRHRLLIALVAGLSTVVAAEASVAAEVCLATVSKATISEVVDSRSLRLADGRVIRLAGIEPFAVLSSDPEPMEAALLSRLNTLATNREIEIQEVALEPDRYGRIVAMVSIDDQILQETLASEGLAVAFASDDSLPCFDEIVAAENDAREKHRGFWTGQLPNARPEALASWIGRFAIFEGKILSVGNRRARTYLNFGFRWTQDVTAEIAAEDRELFGGEAVLEALKGQRVRVRGFVQESGGPMVVLRSPMQLEVLSGDSTTTGKAP